MKTELLVGLRARGRASDGLTTGIQAGDFSRSSRSPTDSTLAIVRVDGLTLHDPKVFLTDCDGKAVRTALPLAAFRVSGRLFWVVHELGYKDESYGIAEISPSGIRYPITANGGGC